MIQPVCRCEHCHTDFSSRHPRGRFCSAKCRKAAWRRERTELDSRQRELIKALAKLEGLTAEDLA